MPRLKRPVVILAAACLVLAAAFAVFQLRYSHAAAWRLAAEERIWVDRALAAATGGPGRTRDDFERTTRPILWHPPGQTCVGLMSHRRYADGSYIACFDDKGPRPVSEREIGSTFGRQPLTDPLWALIW